MLQGIYAHPQDGEYYYIDLECEHDWAYFNSRSGTKFIANDDYKSGVHHCKRSALYEDITHYHDALQCECHLKDDELYVVVYFRFIGADELEECVDFGVTNQEIVSNVLANKYVEGATYYTMGQMFKATKEWLEETKHI